MSDNVLHALSGAVGGVLATAVTYPLLVISTRAQVARDSGDEGHASLWQSARAIVQRDGATGLYAGVGSSMNGIFVTNAVYYYLYEKTRAAIGATTRSPTARESIAMGTVAGAGAVILTNPLWVLNTRETARSSGKQKEKRQDTPWFLLGGHANPLNLVLSLHEIIETEGVGRLFAGVGPALVLVVNPIMQYAVFEQVKPVVERRRHGSRLLPLDYFLIGALGKLIATGSTYPLVTIKARLQLRSSRNSAHSDVLAELKSLLASPRQLYRGLASKLLQSVLTAAFLFMFKESLFRNTKRAFTLAAMVKRAAREHAPRGR